VRSETLTRLETENCQLEDDSNAGYDNVFTTIITWRAKLLIANWLRQGAFFLNFLSDEGKITNS